MDTNTVLLVICAVLTGIWAVYTRMLHNTISEMRLDLHELYFLTRDMALEDAAYTVAGEGDEDYCTYTKNGVTE